MQVLAWRCSAVSNAWILVCLQALLLIGSVDVIFAVAAAAAEKEEIELSEPRKSYEAALSSATSTSDSSHIMCYTCHFHVQKGHSQGMENCRDPFLKSGIPEVPCQGPCGKIYRRLSADEDKDEDEYMIIRNCVPNCKDLSDDKGFTSCCSDKLCNRATSVAMTTGWTVIFTSLLVSALLSRLAR